MSISCTDRHTQAIALPGSDELTGTICKLNKRRLENAEQRTASDVATITVRVGGNGNDTLTGTANADMLFGENGDDTLSGLDGNDLLCGGRGNDSLFGGTGADHFSGGQGADSAADITPADGDTQDGTIP